MYISSQNPLYHSVRQAGTVTVSTLLRWKMTLNLIPEPVLLTSRRYHVISFFFSSCIHGKWKFPGQRSSPSLVYNLPDSCHNIRSLTCCTRVGTPSPFPLLSKCVNLEIAQKLLPFPYFFNRKAQHLRVQLQNQTLWFKPRRCLCASSVTLRVICGDRYPGFLSSPHWYVWMCVSVVLILPWLPLRDGFRKGADSFVQQCLWSTHLCTGAD